ncbi:hypothetical protein GQ53DRAFT_755957 [Thozetella sp. PMI_491]|nr:hypothetical protein GQ53DRAFT_755957 [Thozetella sp. PMI_491]
MKSLIKFLPGVIIRVFLTVSVVIIDKQVVQRRDQIVHKGRQLQNIYLPESVCVIADTEPGILYRDLQLAAELLGFTCLIASLGLVLAIFKGTLWDFWVFGFLFVSPACLIGVLFLSLSLAKRRLLGDRGEIDDTRSSGHSRRNSGLERSIHWVWADVW